MDKQLKKLPNVGKHPFYQATTPDDFRKTFGDGAQPPGGMQPREGWDLAYFSIRMNGNRISDIGWIKPPFAVSALPAGDGALIYIVTHLASGMAIASVDSLENARAIAETACQILGWDQVTVAGAPKVLLDAYFEAMKTAGFAERLIDHGGSTLLLWTRTTAN